MPEPKGEFRRTLRWSAVAARALNELRVGEKALRNVHAVLVVSEARRQEEMAAGGIFGDNEARGGGG
ncbi:hypothetical protein GN958_ATG01941 [Phytophthora infestans]|uniref:Uncharacterized protein n=1 Tax=Phytophthora infestans TaxID=4787 RepID=A0A8S9V9K8_PHYIN|nr:hypothetical protein GN958_ATG01941 [Phytophthora infestans]